jgi:hypothetical protein
MKGSQQASKIKSSKEKSSIEKRKGCTGSKQRLKGCKDQSAV